MTALTENGPLGLYYEEFDVGQMLVTRGRTVTEADIVQFGTLTGDFNPMHMDAEYCKTSFMGKRVAHGMLGISYAIGQLYQLGVLDGTILAFRELEAKFSVPIFIGDTITIKATVKEKKDAARLGGGMVKFDLRIINQEGKTITKAGITLLMASKPTDEA
ncbi:MAG: MaoC/PaaZ C-terminal domain-containing protein [Anaerolineae bacterium]|nr:MaoC/PaaZ C-terminal domain-containing protein [Anaerolineae bacterium]MDQ7035587.1 MaoC/PaaZ C-terminal domain-containing protein [Anaerolineae bacterium]